MEIKVDLVRLAEIQSMLAQVPAVTERHTRIAITKGLMLLQREIAEATPTGANQLLRKSIIAQPVQVSESGLIGVVGTSLNYAVPVEIGTRPHFPPLAPLQDWVVAKLGIEKKRAKSVAFLIARKISKQGTKGAFMFRDTFKRLQPTINGYFSQARQAIIAELIEIGWHS